MPDPVYAYPFSPGITPGRIDQGQDFAGAGDIRTIGPARFVRVAPQGSGTGWPGAAGSGTGAMIVYQLTGGPQAGRYVYTAENIDPSPGLKEGSELPAGTIFAHARGSYPYIETGWAADPHGTPTGHSEGYTLSHEFATKAGQDFQRFLLGLPRYPFGSASSADTGGSSSGPSRYGQIPTQHPPGGAALPSLPGLGGIGSAIGSEITALGQDRFTPGGSQGAIGQTAGAVTSVGDFLGKLGQASFWIRVLEVGGGGLLILLGLAIVGRSLTTQSAVVGVAEGARTLRNATPGRRSAERIRRSAPRTRASTVRDYGTTRAPSASHLREAEKERRIRAEDDIPF